MSQERTPLLSVRNLVVNYGAIKALQGVDLDVMRVAIRHSNYDMRLSRNTIDGYNRFAIPALVAAPAASMSPAWKRM